MSITEKIAAIRDRHDLDDDGKRRRIYAEKTAALLDVIQNGRPRVKPLVGRTVKGAGFTFRINDARITEQPALRADVTFNGTVTHQITLVNPPVLPRASTGNEKKDLLKAVSEMLEGFA